MQVSHFSLFGYAEKFIRTEKMKVIFFLSLSFAKKENEMSKRLMIISLIVLAISAWIMYSSASKTNQVCQTSLEISRPREVQEDFVASNARNVGKDLATIVELDALGMQAAFTSVINANAGTFDMSKYAAPRLADADRSETNRLIDVVLARANAAADRRFHRLDLQSVKRESTFDPKDRGLIDRYEINLFVQEKDSRRVHASAYQMSMTFIYKPSTDQLQILKLFFITDNFYKDPLVGGENIYDRNFRIENKFHLVQPWKTSNDKVLSPDPDQIGLLKDHNNDLRQPRYRCFQEEGAQTGASTLAECGADSGYWDQPVQSNEQCPFFKANKNYSNQYGGIVPDGEFCEMPINSKRVGYRFISSDPVNKPFCYNCRIGADGNVGGIGPCCDEQLNKQLYPNLVSPDYAFPSDVLERGQQWPQLKARGLNWQKHPTRIQEITDRNQKQPVFNAIIGTGSN